MATAIVIGGARRLGKAIALSLANSGFDVGITWKSNETASLETQTELQELGVRTSAAYADVANSAELTSAMDSLTATLGFPAVIVVNAGVFPEKTPVEMLNAEHLLQAVRVNTAPIVTVGSWYLTKAVESNNLGRLISIGSIGAVQIWHNRLPYNVSKAALSTAVASLARSCAPHIAVNAVAPGMIIIPDEPSVNDAAAKPASGIPMQRYGTVADVTEAVTWFAKATHYITGQTIYVDGGLGLLS